MSQAENTKASPEAQLPEPLTTSWIAIHAPFTAEGRKLFAVQDGVNALDALGQASCLMEVAIDLLGSIDPIKGTRADYELACRAAGCVLEPAKRVIDAVHLSMEGPQFSTDVPGGEA